MEILDYTAYSVLVQFEPDPADARSRIRSARVYIQKYSNMVIDRARQPHNHGLKPHQRECTNIR